MLFRSDHYDLAILASLPEFDVRAIFFHAAGRKIYLHNEQYRAYTTQKANKLSIAGTEVSVYQFDSIAITAEKTTDGIVFTGILNAQQSNIKVFRHTNPAYNDIMVSTLSGLLRKL